MTNDPQADDLTPLNESEDSGEFAAMLAAAENAAPEEAKVGDKVRGKIIQIGPRDAFIDCGLRLELPLAVSELQDDQGQLQHQVGDEITAHIAKGDNGLKLTMSLHLREAGRDALQQAYDSGTPVEGKVGATNKGGFTVDLGGVRAFCPFSQIDVRRAEDPTVFVGRTFSFRIIELSDDGRNVIVSRRELLQAGRDALAADTRASLKLGDDFTGTVTRLVPFGAFVDIGGIEGLVHISQISHQRINDPADVLREGQSVQVRVLEIQGLGQGKSERVSLSIKALAADPWPEGAAQLEPATDVTGQVTRLVDFGVFVSLLPGIEGLIHISELANRRIIHPREVLNEGDSVVVRVLEVDAARHRISLSLRQSSEYEGD